MPLLSSTGLPIPVLLADDEQVSTPEFVRRIARALGKKPRIVPFPLFALKALFRVSGRSEASDSIAGSQEVDTSKALKTGWRPPFSLDEGLRNALRTTGDAEPKPPA